MFDRWAGLASRLRRVSVVAFLAAAIAASGALTAQTAASPPLPNGGFEEGTPGAAPSFWQLGGSGGGYRAVLDPVNPHQGRTSAHVSRRPGAGAAGPSDFGALSAQLDAAPYRGKRIRYSAAIRVLPGRSGFPRSAAAARRGRA
jgi:hypothetical protein